MNQPIRKRYGTRGTRVFNRILGTIAAVELSIPVLLFFATGALAADSNPAITVPLLLTFNLVCLAVAAMWWKRTHRS